MGQHVAHHIAARRDRGGKRFGVAGEVLGDVVAARNDRFGELVADVFQLRHHIAAAQTEIKNDRFARGLERVVHLVGAQRDGLGDSARGVDQPARHRLGAVRNRLGELARADFDGVQHRGALLREAVHDLIEARGQRLVQVGGDREQLLVEAIGFEVETRCQPVARRIDRMSSVVAGAFEPVQEIGAALAKLLDHGAASRAERDRNVLTVFGERAGDALRRLVDALRDQLAHRRDVVRQVEVHIGNGVADLLGLTDQGLALLREAVEQMADTHLVIIVRAFQRSDLVVDEGFEFGCPSQRAFDAVAHRSDFAADRLADRNDGIAGNDFRFGETQRRFSHGAGDNA